MPYFLIYNSDGDTIVKDYSKKDILKYHNDFCFLDKMPDDPDTNYWPENSALIIKGKIVTPKPVEKIITYELD